MIKAGLEAEKPGWAVGVGIKMLVGCVDWDTHYALLLPVPPGAIMDIVSLALKDKMDLLADMPVLSGTASRGYLLDETIEKTQA